MEQTEVVRYSDKLKDDFGLLVFPEAYACLKPMVGRGKVSTGMSLIIDIGGGTTDISFFTIENGQPQVYDFFSVDKGLNFLTGVDAKSPGTPPSNKIISENTTVFYTEIVDLCNNLVERLKSEFKSQTELEVRRLTDALKNRPLIYTGGGSTYKEVLYRYNDFKELHTISYDNWKSKLFDDDALFRDSSLCPVLSTAYGLSISVATDDITKKPLRDIFAHIRGVKEETEVKKGRKLGEALGGFDYGTDWDAWK